MSMIKVEGTKKGDFKLYGLSTCIWCKKTKELLDNKNIEYMYVFVDKLDQDTKTTVKDELRKWNPDCSYPTLVVNEKKCIVGFDEDEIVAEIG